MDKHTTIAMLNQLGKLAIAVLENSKQLKKDNPEYHEKLMYDAYAFTDCFIPVIKENKK